MRAAVHPSPSLTPRRLPSVHNRGNVRLSGAGAVQVRGGGYCVWPAPSAVQEQHNGRAPGSSSPWGCCGTKWGRMRRRLFRSTIPAALSLHPSRCACRGGATPASDLYALGGTLLYLASGQPPYAFPQERMRIAYKDRVTVGPQLGGGHIGPAIRYLLVPPFGWQANTRLTRAYRRSEGACLSGKLRDANLPCAGGLSGPLPPMARKVLRLRLQHSAPNQPATTRSRPHRAAGRPPRAGG